MTLFLKMVRNLFLLIYLLGISRKILIQVSRQILYGKLGSDVTPSMIFMMVVCKAEYGYIYHYFYVYF